MHTLPASRSRRVASALASLTPFLAAALLLVGCADKKKVPEPPAPSPVPVEPLGAEPPPTKVHLGGLILSSTPPMKVKVDGKVVGTTPLTVDNVSIGHHDVIFLQEDGETVTMGVEIGEGEYKRLNHSLTPSIKE